MAKEMFLSTPDRVADAVRGVRRERDLSQIELARQANVGRRFIQDLEAGHPRAEIGKVLDVLDALDIHAIALPSVPSPQRRGEIDLKKVAGRG